MTLVCSWNHYNWNGSSIQNLFLALKWVSPNFCVVLYLLFDGFYFGHFQKEKQINPRNDTMSL